MGLPQRLSWLKKSACNVGDTGDASLIPMSGRSPGQGNGNPLQYFLLEKSHGKRILAGYGPKGHKESDETEHTRTYTK